MKVEKLDKPREHYKDSIIRVKEMGNIVEILQMEKMNQEPTIQKLDKENYVIISTGEICQFEHNETRADDKGSIAKSLRRLREVLNTNITDVKCCRWITLTYKENMIDPVKLYKDFEKFNKRMRYWLKKNDLENYEYIVAMEPQGRGAWHCHIVMIFPHKAPYIKNKLLAEKWGNGFVTVKALDDVDNVGAYLTAYLGDMELEDACKSNVSILGKPTSLKDYTDDDGVKKSKCYVKGARLCMYPPGFRIFRMSRGLKEPIEYITTNEKLDKKISSAKLTFEKTIKITSDDMCFENIINYRYYNKTR